MSHTLSGRAKKLVGRNKPPLFLKHQILGMLTRWSQNHYAKGLRTLNNRVVIIRITHADLAVISFLLLEFMNQETGLCLPNQGTIAQRIGVSRNTVNKAVKKWKTLGVLGVIKRKCIKPSTGKDFPINTSCFYHLTKNIYKRLRHALSQKFSFIYDFTIDSKKLNVKYQKPFRNNALPLFDTSDDIGHQIDHDTEQIRQPIQGLSTLKAPSSLDAVLAEGLALFKRKD